MKFILKISLLLLFPIVSMAQNAIYDEPTRKQADALLLEFQQIQNDTIRMEMCKKLGAYYEETNLDRSIYFYELQLRLARQLNQKLWEALANNGLGYSMFNAGNYAKSLHYLLQALNLAEDKECEKNIWKITAFSKKKDPHYARMYVLSSIYDNLGILYKATGDTQKAKSNYYKSLKIGEEVNDPIVLSLVNFDLGSLYFELNKLDSALLFQQKALTYVEISGYTKYSGLIYRSISEIYAKKEISDSAIINFYRGIHECKKNASNLMTLAELYLSIAKYYTTLTQSDSSIVYAAKSLKIIKQLQTLRHLPEIYSSLSSAYRMIGKQDSAYIYLELAMNAQGSLTDADKIRQFQNIGFNEQLRLQELEKEKIQTKNKIRTYSLLAGIAVFMFIAYLSYINNRNRKKANKLLQSQKEEIEEQKKNVEQTLIELKSTQSQLIQSEKMASLGELTAGIAHEIQNPLNFVNNFSEVNSEMIDELNEELNKGDIEEAKAISKDIKNNEQKINHHGKRAEAIVKGMLQHSRTNSGGKELTDINALADEYLRLSYHGLRAKDKTFNTDFKTEFDESLPKINVVPQDIGRILLNLINNAFYAVNEKAIQNVNDYKPSVVVSTRLINNKVEIRVQDNGNGIPDSVKDKIFQPFFTTKPAGQGTGLGLSLSYDIVKAHGGKLHIESSENSGTEFIVEIPLKS